MNKKENISKSLKAYTKEVCSGVMKTDFDILAKITETILDTKQTGATIYIAGNGGSAATASHMANDLVKGCRVYDRTGFKAVCLNDSTPIVTCLANDFSYEEIYSIMLETYAKKGDVYVVYSGSGNSPNIVHSVKTAKAMGMTVIAFGGRDGGKMKDYCDLIVIAPTESMEQLEDMHMMYEHNMVCALQGQLKDIWDVEIVKYKDPNTIFNTALFDFDGTISLIREGWQEIMTKYFLEVLVATPKCESLEAVTEVAMEFIARLTGKQTIFQCMALAEEVTKRAGTPLTPLEYKVEYLRRLDEKIKDRHKELMDDPSSAIKYVVKGSFDLLDGLVERGITLHLASGTDEEAVIREAKLLGIDKYFKTGIHGAKDDITDCSKEIVIKNILSNSEIKPEELISFGDGFVEIELVADLGGYAVAVASDESRKVGIDDWKRNRLKSAGASAVIPDFENTNRLFQLLDI